MSIIWQDFLMILHEFLQKSHVWFMSNGLRILLYILLGIISTRLIRRINFRVRCKLEEHDTTACEERDRRARTIEQVVKITSKIFIWAIVVIMILREVGANIAPLLAGAGIAGLALGFGAQSLVKDILNGFFIILENQYRVGDFVRIADKSGTVESILLRTTIIRSFDGIRHVIPNGQITAVDNLTFAESRALIKVSISYKSDVDKAIELLKQIGEEMKNDPRFSQNIREFRILGVDNLASSAVEIAVLIFTDPMKQWEIGREFRYRVKKLFDASGIEIPFPHQTVYLRTDEPMKISKDE